MGAIISAAVSVLGAIVAWVRAVQARQQQDRATLNSLMNKSIDLAMQYPHLERDSYCSAWPDDVPEDQDMKDRYESYCCFLFNMIEEAWHLAGKKPHKIASFVPIREHVQRHYRWWEADRQNLHGYEKAFVDYISSVINDLKKEGLIT